MLWLGPGSFVSCRGAWLFLELPRLKHRVPLSECPVSWTVEGALSKEVGVFLKGAGVVKLPWCVDVGKTPRVERALARLGRVGIAEPEIQF